MDAATNVIIIRENLHFYLVMRNLLKKCLLFLSVGLNILTLYAQDPVNPNATDETRILLKYLYNIRGNGMISGMHNFQQDPVGIDTKVKAINGNIEPGLWGNDFRYGSDVQYRMNVAKEAINQWRNKGKLVTYMYHQVRPMDEETAGWSSVQGDISNDEFDELLTDGTALNTSWKEKMNDIGKYFSILQDSAVPVIFRPYHEMNGGWFWWGGKKENERYKKLYQMTYHYLTDSLQINNILWVLNFDDTNTDFESYYPGEGYIDAFAVDVYGGSFPQNLYDAMKAIAGNRPIAIGELDKMIDFNHLTSNQTDWIWWMGWRDDYYLKVNTDEQVKSHFIYPYMINADNIIMNDTVGPSDVDNLQANNTASMFIEVAWPPSSDNSHKVIYNVFKDSELVGRTIDTVFLLYDLVPSTSYLIAVSAQDPVNNFSNNVTEATFMTNEADLVQPLMPDSLTSYNFSISRIDIFWEAATDNEGVSNYVIYLNGDSLTSTENQYYFFKQLDPDTEYKIEIYARDLSGNISEPLVQFIHTLPLETGLIIDEFRGFNIYPNPTDGIIHIAPPQFSGEYNFKLFDVRGRTMLDRENYSGLTSVDLSRLPKGFYYMFLTSEEQTAREKLILK